MVDGHQYRNTLNFFFQFFQKKKKKKDLIFLKYFTLPKEDKINISQGYTKMGYFYNVQTIIIKINILFIRYYLSTIDEHLIYTAR